MDSAYDPKLPAEKLAIHLRLLNLAKYLSVHASLMQNQYTAPQL